jgi:gamma-glutamyltranspeptidase/glutathione hydrolase
LHGQPGFAQAFLPDGRAPKIGELFRLPAAAQTLRRIAQTKGRAFYEEDIAEKIVAFSRAENAALNLYDLGDYRPQWVAPIKQRFRDYELYEIPPNGQGIAALIALGILNHFDLRNLPVDSPESQHLQIEAMKLAFTDVYQYVADPARMEVTPEQMLSEAYLAERASQIAPHLATQFQAGRPYAGGTIYLASADDSGMMVSFIQSNYMGFGSGVVVPGTGISLQNRGVGFSMDPKSANAVMGGKRPFHTIIPGFLTQNGQPVMSFGVMGGDMQPQGHVQTLVRMIDYDQQPQTACCAPRWKVNRDYSLDIEQGVPPNTIEGLKRLGHRMLSFEDSYMDFGAGQFIWKLSGSDAGLGYVAASDSRRDGQAVGF